MNNLLRHVLIAIVCVLAIPSFCQDLKVKSFSMQMEPMTVPMQRNDANGQVCALIKVQLPIVGVQFEGNIVGNVLFKTNEYWVYVTPGTKNISIKTPGYYTKKLKFEEFGIKSAKSKNIYLLVLTTDGIAISQQTRNTNYLVMSVSPSNAIVKIDGNIHEIIDNVVTALLPVGKHFYQVEASGYTGNYGDFEIIPSEKTKMTISLISTKAKLVVSTDNDVSIYVNDELKGKGYYKGEYVPALYNVELQKPGYRTYVQTIELKPNETFNMTHNEFIPIYGTLNVDYRPIGSKIILDGEVIGESPQMFDSIPIGNYSIVIEHPEFQKHIQNIEITDGALSNVIGTLKRTESTTRKVLTPEELVRNRKKKNNVDVIDVDVVGHIKGDLIGASILNKSKNTGVASDIDGNFRIKATVGDTIVIQYIGYKRHVITFDRYVPSQIDVKLSKGKGTTKKSY